MDNPAASPPSLARKLGLFDATMIVMGGIIGSGIFVNPYVVARQVHTSALILGAWILGGLTALAGAFIYAELAILRPNLGGQYAYLREAYHPAIAFLYGWALLLIMQTGGMAAVAVTFARYAREIVHSNASDGLIATLILALLTLINCFGVRSGSSVQSALMVLKIGAIGGLLIAGFRAPAPAYHPAPSEPLSPRLLVTFGAAVTPVLFAYGGWQTASFMTGEMRKPGRDLARALLHSPWQLSCSPAMKFSSSVLLIHCCTRPRSILARRCNFSIDLHPQSSPLISVCWNGPSPPKRA